MNALSSQTHTNKNEREDVIVTLMTPSGFGIACASCGDSVIAPYWSQFVCREQVRHFWVCESCGQGFDTTVELGRKAAAKKRPSAHGEQLCALT